MRIGQFEFGIAKGSWEWGFYAIGCGCKSLDIGPLYFIWLHKECKCGTCKEYKCGCKG